MTGAIPDPYRCRERAIASTVTENGPTIRS